jgi:Na+-driven multidrug efflux pump
MGLAMGLQMIVITSSALAMLGLVNRHGVVVTAAYSVTQQLWTYVQMPAMALGAAASAMAAQNIGAGNWSRVSRITGSAVLFSIVLTGSIVLLLTLADRTALGLFLGGGSPAIPVGQHIHRMATWGFVFFGVTMVLFGTIRANGAVIWPLIILFIAMYPVRLGFALAAEPWLGTDALWLSFPLGSIVAMGLAIAVYLNGGWKKAKLTHRPMEESELIEFELADGEPGGSLNPRG